MTKGIIQKVFDRKIKYMPEYMTAFVLEELKHELVLELAKEFDSFPSDKPYRLSMFRKWLIGNN
jgi:hypothetical protein